MTERDVAEAVARVRARIADAAVRAGRSGDDVLLLGACKGIEPERIEAAVRGGLSAVGENRVQDLLRKRAQMAAPVRWDFIGALQRNKVAKVTGEVTLIHGVDGIDLARAVGAAAVTRGVTQQILLEVNTSGEPTKHGCAPAEAPALAVAVQDVAGIRLRGLMTIAAPGDPDAARRSFARLRAIADEIEPGLDGPCELSMGMSDDLEIAVEEGATIVRVGTAIFGARS